MSDVLQNALGDEKLIAAAQRVTGGETVQLGGVWGSSGPLVAAAMGRLSQRGVLFVTPHLDDADSAVDDIEVFTGRRVELFPAWEADAASADHINDEIAGERLGVCNLLGGNGDRSPGQMEFIVAPAVALLQPVPSPDVLAAARRTLRRGDEMPPEGLAVWLVEAGFEHVDQVDQQGEFARRGGILDIFPAGVGQAVRLEFFGDVIESIRLFDLDTQRSTDHIDAYEVMSIAAGRDCRPDRTTTLLSYLPAKMLVCMVEPDEVRDFARSVHGRFGDISADGKSDVALFSPDEVFGRLGEFATVEMYTFASSSAGMTDLGIRSLQRLNVNTHEAISELGELADQADVWVYCENPAEKRRFGQLLTSSHPSLVGRLRTTIGHIGSGFHWPARRLVAVGHHEVFHRYTRLRRIRRVRAGRPIESLLDLQEGDYVVHVAHGIAKFEGLRRLEHDGRSEEYLTLRFAGSSVMHVPASRINLVQKYIGSRRARPTLSSLGGVSWKRQKQRVADAVHDLAAEMIHIQAMRQSTPGVSYPGGTDWQRQFADEFVYTETEDQLASMDQIEDDMLRTQPMDRLLCGDVGYGKTELAMRAAFKVVEAGRQVAILVPTTVLAQQHYSTFRERMADYPFEVEVISRFRTAGQQRDIVKRLTTGQVDIIIGTHRLLSSDVRFADLGLVVIDEEQRFGVEHKERLKHMRSTVDVLTMTATPIPRTLHMALLGLRDICSLTTPPMDRRAIHTEVCRRDDGLIRQGINRELDRQGQVFFVHNRVMDIEPLAKHIRTLVPDARVAVAHGQMPQGQLQQTMTQFVKGMFDVLVCTTIIESGLDIPKVNTIFIHNADRFGLSELHQLRGRVGRYKHRAYCYLLLPDRRPVTHIAARRLKAIEEFSDLGAGFAIAMRDLEIRGAGNILGVAQSGHIAVVGYELYCQLLEQAVGDLRGDKTPPRHDVHVELAIDAYIPKSYIPSQRQRMEVYRRMVRCPSADDLRQVATDLADAYGPPPMVVETMLDLAEVRIRAGQLGISSIIRMDPDLVFSIGDRAAGEALEGAPGSVRMPDDKTIHWRPPSAYWEMPTLVRVLLKRLREAEKTTVSGKQLNNSN